MEEKTDSGAVQASILPWVLVRKVDGSKETNSSATGWGTG